VDEGGADHGEEGFVVDFADAVVDPDAVVVEFGDAAWLWGGYRSHCLQWRDVGRT